MDISGLVEKSVTALGARFALVGLLPATVFVILCGFLVLGGAPANAPQLGIVLKAMGAAGPTDAVLLAVAILLLAVILQPFQTSFVRVLEGYWGSLGPVRFLSEILASRHRKRRDQVQSEIERLQTLAASGDTEKTKLGVEAGMLADRLARSYPTRKFLPTTLGNVLRAAEENGGVQYGLDAVTIWPLLYAVLPVRTLALVDDQRNQLDIAASFCVMSGLATVFSCCLLYRHGWWLVVPAATLLMSWIAYRGAILGAYSYGVGIKLAIELHRFDLLTALHLPLPGDRDTEVKSNRALSDFLRQGRPENFKYEHPPRRANGQ